MSAGMSEDRAQDTGAFAVELEVRLAEARAQLAAAEVLDDPMLAQIAEADVRELEALALRNDIRTEQAAS